MYELVFKSRIGPLAFDNSILAVSGQIMLYMVQTNNEWLIIGQLHVTYLIGLRQVLYHLVLAFRGAVSCKGGLIQRVCFNLSDEELRLIQGFI